MTSDSWMINNLLGKVSSLHKRIQELEAENARLEKKVFTGRRRS